MRKEIKLILILKAEKFFDKSGVSLKKAYEILEPEIRTNSPSHIEFIYRYIPGDPKDTFEFFLN